MTAEQEFVARSADPSALNVLVMGMHRSGTSALATALRAAGLSAGEAPEGWSPSAENPFGFAERRDVVALNDRLLQSLGWTWSSPPAAPPAVAPERPELVQEGRALVAGRLAPTQPWFVKDPRLSLLLPWWRQIVLDRFVAVVMVRPPDEVAWSLSVRNGFPVELGLALWAAYHRHLAQGLDGLPVLVVDYVSLTEDPGATMGLVVSALERVYAAGALDPERAIAAIRPTLRRATAPASQGKRASLASLERLAAQWLMGPVTLHERFSMEKVEPAAWEESILQVQRSARREEARAVAAMAASATAREDAIRALAEAEAARQEAVTLRDDLVRLRAAHAELKVLRQSAARASRRAETLSARLTQVRGERSAAQRALAARDAEADELRAHVSALELERERSTRLAQDLRAELTALRTAKLGSDAQAAAGDRRAVHLRDELADERRARREQERELVALRDERVSAIELRNELERLQGCVAAERADADRLLLAAYRAAYSAHLVRRRSWPYAWFRPLFDAAWYAKRYPDVRASRLPVYWHFLRHGRREGRRPNAYFDGEWYLSRYPDVSEHGLDPLDHYIRCGATEGRDPSERFSTLDYLRANPHVVAAGLNPLEHLLASERQDPSPNHGSAPQVSPSPEHSPTAGASNRPPAAVRPGTPARAWSYFRRHGAAAFMRKAAAKGAGWRTARAQRGMRPASLPAESMPDAIQAALDLPLEGTSESSMILAVAGWACSSSGIKAISVFVDGVAAGAAETGLPRPDVAEALPTVAGADRAGFSTSMRIDELAEGEHRLTVVVEDAAGHVRLITRSFQRMTAASLYHHYYERTLPGPEELRVLHRLVGDERNLPQVNLWVDARGGGLSRATASATLRSISEQDYPAWRCTVLADESRRPMVEAVLQELADGEARFSVATGPDQLPNPKGGYIGIIRAGERLAPGGLVPLVHAAIEKDAPIVYSDHDQVEASGRHVEPQIAPDHSPEHLLSRNYVGGFYLAKMSAELHGLALTALATGRRAWRYDLLLRLLDAPTAVAHVPRILWSSPAQRVGLAGESTEEVSIVEEAIARRGLVAEVSEVIPGIRRLRWQMDERPKVSIIVPTTGRMDHLAPCVSSILERTTYENYELLFIDNGRGAHRDGIAHLRSLGLRVLERNEPFNWAKLNNDGARETDGELLLFLNDDIEVRDGEWLTELVAQAIRPGVGSVGAMLLFPDGMIQHAGIFLVGHGGGAMHFFHHQDPDGEVYLNLHRATREVAANTGACLMVRRDLFEQVGGFDTDLAVVGNDVDLCLRLLEQGYRNVWTPHAVLIHHESVSRGAMSIDGDESKMWDRWSALLRRGDPYFSPHFAQDRPDCVIAWDRPSPRRSAEDAHAADAGVNLVGYIRAEMGVGQATRGDALALSEVGMPFVIIDYSDGNPARMGDESWMHKLATRAAFDVNLVRINADWIAQAASRLGSDVFDGRYTIGCWAWELPEFPDRWRSAFDLVNEVWVPSRFVRQAIAAKSPVPVVHIPHAVQAPAGPFHGREHFGLPRERFQLLMMYDVHSVRERKNPDAALRSFVQAFDAHDDGVALVIKVNNADRREEKALRELVAGRTNVFVIDRILDRAEVDSLVAVSDCYVSLHRSEGFGLPIAEAMALAKPVIATNWSGNVDFMDEQNSACVGYELVQIGAGVGPYDAGQWWAEPDIAQASEWMRRLRANGQLARALGERARETVERELSPRRVGQLMAERIAEIRAGQAAGRRTPATDLAKTLRASSATESQRTNDRARAQRSGRGRATGGEKLADETRR